MPFLQFEEIFKNTLNPMMKSAPSAQSPSFDQKSIVAADLHDTNNLTNSAAETMACRGFTLNASATLHYLNAYDQEVTYTFPAGQYSIPIKRIFATGTTLADNVMLAEF